MTHALETLDRFRTLVDRRDARWTSPASRSRPRTRNSAIRLRAFIAEHVTEEVLQRDREFGENFDEKVHLALGEAGYLAADWKLESEGGFSPVRRRIFDLEIGRAHTPWYHWGTTAAVARFVQQFGAPELTDAVLPGVLSGEIRLCLGYTEPEGGSDVATCKTRAVRDGDTWIINGSKMFTSNAQNAKYVFLLTNTDPQGPKTQEPDHVSGAAGFTGHRDSAHPHAGRRPHQHRLLQRRPRRRPLPHR